jgi:Mlc titration factor MtfA (ptsG expression regulator)
MIFGWLKTRRRRRLLTEPLPDAWREVLRRRVRQYQYLPAAQRERIEQIVRVMIAEKDWAAAAGFEMTDEVRVTVAGIAALIVSGLDEPYFYDRLSTVVVHRGTIRFSPDHAAGNPHLPNSGPLDGVAWQRGPVLVSWAAVRDERRGPTQGRNVVIHEFAHHLDGLNGAMDGIPPLPPDAEDHWRDVTEQELQWLEEEARHGEPSLLDHDGAESPAEFFAVASERFFELPHEMCHLHPDLFEALAEFYHQDPTRWMPRRDIGGR